MLPKFKIAVTTDKPYYLPGEEVNGTVKANYFFGKPVADGKVTVDSQHDRHRRHKTDGTQGHDQADRRLHVPLHASEHLCRAAVRAG